jgi:hypothetical protein
MNQNLTVLLFTIPMTVEGVVISELARIVATIRWCLVVFPLKSAGAVAFKSAGGAVAVI